MVYFWTNEFNNNGEMPRSCALCIVNVPWVICLWKDVHLIYYFNSLFLVWALRQWGVLIIYLCLLRSVVFTRLCF